MTIKYIDDVLNERAERKRKEFEEKFSKGIKEGFDKMFPGVRRKFKIAKFLFKLFGLLFLIVLVLGLVWLIKLLITNLFF